MLAGITLILIVSGVDPKTDRYTWFLETLPVMIGIILLVATQKTFTLTTLLYRLLALHAIILMIGGHYSYAEVPMFNWLRDTLELSRNHYDRVGHFFQGFVPAILARELLLRKTSLRPSGWLFFIVSCIALAFSAFYEMIEWWVALASDAGATAFLGTQGDPWDTQWDMFLALVGALSAQLLLGRTHDQHLENLERHNVGLRYR